MRRRAGRFMRETDELEIGRRMGVEEWIMAWRRFMRVQGMVSECRFEHPDGVRAAAHAVIVKDERFAALHR